MTGRELFVALTRWFGVLLVIYGVYDVAYNSLKNVLSDLPSKTSIATGLIFAGIYFVLGAGLLFGAGALARLTYGSEKSN